MLHRWLSCVALVVVVACGGADPCADDPCQNGGACVVGSDTFVCVCPAGYTGATCATDVDDCDPNPCFNGGTCTDGVDRFTCTCATGYAGTQCERDVDDCGDAPCANGGVCIDQLDGFVCICAAGYTGATCDTDIDDCAPNPCFNGGTCVDGVDQYTCTCPADYWGRQCEAAVAQLEIATSALPLGRIGSAYAVALAWTGGTGGARWTIEPGSTNTDWLAIDPVTGAVTGTPLASNQGPATLVVRVAETIWPANYAEQTYAFEVVDPTPIYSEDFEGTCPVWSLTGDWECGVPSSVGPAAAHGGTQCIATKIAGVYSDSQSYGGTHATSPAIVLPSLAGVQVRFYMWIDTEGSIYDGVNLQVSDDGVSYAVLTSVTPAYGLTIGGQPAWGGHQAIQGWQLVTGDLSAYAGESIYLRFAFRTDSSGVFPGVYVDDVEVGY